MVAVAAKSAAPRVEMQRPMAATRRAGTTTEAEQPWATAAPTARAENRTAAATPDAKRHTPAPNGRDESRPPAGACSRGLSRSS